MDKGQEFSSKPSQYNSRKPLLLRYEFTSSSLLVKNKRATTINFLLLSMSLMASGGPGFKQ